MYHYYYHLLTKFLLIAKDRKFKLQKFSMKESSDHPETETEIIFKILTYNLADIYPFSNETVNIFLRVAVQALLFNLISMMTRVKSVKYTCETPLHKYGSWGDFLSEIKTQV